MARYLAVVRKRWGVADKPRREGPGHTAWVRRNVVDCIHRSALEPAVLTPTDRWIGYIWEGERLIRQHLWQQAIDCFEGVAALAPDPAEALLRKHLAFLYAAQNAKPSVAAIEALLYSGRRGIGITHPVSLHYFKPLRKGEGNTNAKS